MSNQISVFLQQHIGFIEEWIDSLCFYPTYHKLTDLGGKIIDGVYVDFSELGLQLKPTSIQGNFTELSKTIQDVSLISERVTAYVEYLRELDSAMIQQAASLQERREELEYALVKEELVPGGKLWWRTREGVKHICITNLDISGKVTFEIMGEETTQTMVCTSMPLFSRKEDALNPTKEGYRVKF